MNEAVDSQRSSMRAVAFGFCLLIVSPLTAKDNPHLALDATLDQRVDGIVRPLVAKQQTVGYAVGVIRDGQVVSLRSFGHSDREAAIPVDRRTMFRWASISKTLTAVAALQLSQQGRLDLDADVRSYVPEFPEQKAIVTTRQLLCHQGGIRHYSNGKIVPNERKYTEANPFESVILALDEFKDSPLIAPPGERFSYSTHGYVLLSAVVERAGKQPFASQVSERICEPLGLATLQPDYQWIKIPHRAAGYTKRGKEIERSTDTDVSWKLGGGGFISNIDDLALWCAAVARGELLKPETWKAASTPQATKSGAKSTYGLGFQVKGAGDGLSIGHSGAQEKTRTFLLTFPHQKIGAVAMTNSEFGEPVQVVHSLLKELFAQATDGQSD